MIQIPLKNASKIGRRKCGAYYRARGCAKARGRKGGTSAATQNIVSHEYIHQLKTTLLVQCSWIATTMLTNTRWVSEWPKAQLDIWRASLDISKPIKNSTFLANFLSLLIFISKILPSVPCSKWIPLLLPMNPFKWLDWMFHRSPDLKVSTGGQLASARLAMGNGQWVLYWACSLTLYF